MKTNDYLVDIDEERKDFDEFLKSFNKLEDWQKEDLLEEHSDKSGIDYTIKDNKIRWRLYEN